MPIYIYMPINLQPANKHSLELLRSGSLRSISWIKNEWWHRSCGWVSWELSYIIQWIYNHTSRGWCNSAQWLESKEKKNTGKILANCAAITMVLLWPSRLWQYEFMAPLMLYFRCTWWLFIVASFKEVLCLCDWATWFVYAHSFTIMWTTSTNKMPASQYYTIHVYALTICIIICH